jgi:hypothetical protein
MNPTQETIAIYGRARALIAEGFAQNADAIARDGCPLHFGRHEGNCYDEGIVAWSPTGALAYITKRNINRLPAALVTPLADVIAPTWKRQGEEARDLPGWKPTPAQKATRGITRAADNPTMTQEKMLAAFDQAIHHLEENR